MILDFVKIDKIQHAIIVNVSIRFFVCLEIKLCIFYNSGEIEMNVHKNIEKGDSYSLV